MKLKNIRLSINDEILLKFLAKFKLMLASDAIKIYGTIYFQKRLQELKNANYIGRFHKIYIKLTPAGLRYLEAQNIKCYQPCKNKKNINRLIMVSKIGLELEKAKIKYILSWEIKGNVYTDWSRRFIAELELRNEKYLVYYAKSDMKYIRMMQFDINKDLNYSNVIIFTENVDIIGKNSSFIFSNKVSSLIISTNRINTLERYNKINIEETIERIYLKKPEMADFNIADCKIENRNIVFMPYIDTHKIAGINNVYLLGFIEEQIEIVSFKENIKVIKKILDDRINDKCIFREIEENIFYE